MGNPLRVRAIVAIAVWLAAVVPAVAQPGAPAPPPSPPPTEPSPPPFSWQGTYEQGFAALMVNDLATARAVFQQVAERTDDPELRGAARQMLRLANEMAGHQGKLTFGAGAPAPAGGDEDPDEGRTGIIVTTTLASIYGGIVLADLADTDDARAVTGIITATTAAGFLASLYGTRGRTIHGGTAEAYSLGLLLGAGNGLLLASPLGAETSEQWQTTIFGGLALTAAAGFVYGQSVRPTRGQVSFAGTMASMGLVSAGLGLVITLPDVDSDTVLLTMAAGLDGGAAAGLYFGKDLTWSTGRARLVWLGALLGGLGGVAAAVLTFGDGDDEDDSAARASAALVLGGAWGGLLLSAHLTRHMRPDRRFGAVSGDRTVVPVAFRGGGGLGYAGRF